MPLSRLLLTAVLFTSLVTAVHARIERTIERTFSVNPGGTLSVSTSGGNIEVQPGSGREVRVVARLDFRRASSEAQADQIMDKYEVTIEQQGSDVRAVARPKSALSGWRGNPLSVAFTVTVPAEYSVDLNTSGGNITVGDLTGSAKVRTSGGNLRFGRFNGEIDGSTSGGNISVTEAVRKVELRTSGGDIKVDRATGELKVHTSGGSINIGQISGAVDAHTSGGNIRVGIDGPIARDMSLRTSGGSVVAQVNREAAFRLDASTSGGSVKADGLTLTLEQGGSSRGRLVGSVNGGGPTLTLRTSGGGITVSPL